MLARSSIAGASPAVLALAIFVFASASNVVRSGRSSGSHKHYRSCGNMLIRRLQEVCQNRFANPMEKARLQRVSQLEESGTAPVVVVVSSAAESGTATALAPTRANRHHYHHHHRNAGRPVFVKKPPQVVDACCLQTCSDAFIHEHICDDSSGGSSDGNSSMRSDGKSAAESSDDSVADHLVILKKRSAPVQPPVPVQ